MKIYKIYKILNKKTNKCYIGQTSQSVEKRWIGHLNKSCCRKLSNSIKKHGKDSFSIEWICSSIKESYIDELETMFILLYNTLSPNGYNLRTEGSHPIFSYETLTRLSNSHKKRFNNLSIEEKNKMTEHFSGYIENKKRKVVGINKDYNIIEFSSIYQANQNGYYPGISFKDNITLSRGYLFFYKNEYSYKEMCDIYDKSLSIRDYNYSLGRKTAREKILISTKSKERNIVSINLIERTYKEYLNIVDTEKDGHHRSAVSTSLKRNKNKPTRSLMCHFFYKSKHTIDEMFLLAEETERLISDRRKLGRIKWKSSNHIEKLKKRLIGINPKNLNYFIFNSWAEARISGYSVSAISKGTKGEKVTSKGLHFQNLTLDILEHISITNNLFNINNI